MMDTDNHNAQVFLREYTKIAERNNHGIFLPEVMEKYHIYMTEKENKIKQLEKDEKERTRNR